MEDGDIDDGNFSGERTVKPMQLRARGIPWRGSMFFLLKHTNTRLTFKTSSQCSKSSTKCSRDSVDGSWSYGRNKANVLLSAMCQHHSSLTFLIRPESASISPLSTSCVGTSGATLEAGAPAITSQIITRNTTRIINNRHCHRIKKMLNRRFEA